MMDQESFKHTCASGFLELHDAPELGRDRADVLGGRRRGEAGHGIGMGRFEIGFPPLAPLPLVRHRDRTMKLRNATRYVCRTKICCAWQQRSGNTVAGLALEVGGGFLTEISRGLG
jgi:hypothetical protein